MVETHEYKGLWWLPNNESAKLSGTLTVDEGRAALDVIGHFGHKLLSETEGSKSYSLDPVDQPRIVGLSTSGKAVTLERNHVVSNTVNLPGIPTTRYRQDVALVGKQFADREEVGFDEISIRASDLNTWTQVSGFKGQIGMEQHEKGYLVFSNVEIRFDAPADIEIPLAGGDRAFIRFNAPSKGLGDARTERVELHQEAALHLRFAKRVGLGEVLDRVSQIRNFLSLAVGRPVAILAVAGYQDDQVQGQAQSRIPIEVLWELPYNPDPPSRPRPPQDMLFTLPEATPDISTVMKRWFARQARLAPVFNLFFGVRHHPALTLDVRFLLFAQAVETYDYRRRRKPGDRKLAKRMDDVLNECRTVAKRIVGAGADDQAIFIEEFKTARNYYTHYNPKLEKKAARGAALLLLFVRLQAILEMSVLRELGFGCRSIDTIFERARRYAQIEHFKASVGTENAEDA